MFIIQIGYVMDAPLGALRHRPTPPPGHPMRLSYGWPGGGVGRCRFKNALPRFPKQPLPQLGIEVRAVMRVVGHRHVGRFLALGAPPRTDPFAWRLSDGGMRGRARKSVV